MKKDYKTYCPRYKERTGLKELKIIYCTFCKKDTGLTEEGLKYYHGALEDLKCEHCEEVVPCGFF